MRVCRYICVRAQVCACFNVRACMQATDGRTRMEIWVDLNVCMCVRACATPSACEVPVCEDAMIDSRSDG